MDTEKKQIIVVDVPVGATAQGIEDALNAPYQDGYYFAGLLNTESGAPSRALFRRYRVRAEGPTGTGGPPSNRDGKEGDALAFMGSHPNLTLRETRAALAGRGIKRSVAWLSDKKAELRETRVIKK